VTPLFSLSLLKTHVAIYKKTINNFSNGKIWNQGQIYIFKIYLTKKGQGT